jgi:putative RNA 2'-phosphotransferase
MNEKENKQLSKFLSYVLRHDPSELDITLDANGWTEVSLLLQHLRLRFPTVDMEALEYMVATNSKQRFSFNHTKTMIRANQGHSVPVDLNYVAQVPPTVLFHGTSRDYVKAIMTEGLKKQERHHVHLSENVATALQVAGRRPRACILRIQSAKMHEAGYEYFLTANHIWLTEYVPPEFIEDEF